jgi:YgiT-type zinc finger domain-containing protein
MRCMRCAKDMGRGVSQFRIDRAAVHITFGRVPAWVCPNCGEMLFEESEVNAIQGLVEAVDKQAEKFVGSV